MAGRSSRISGWLLLVLIIGALLVGCKKQSTTTVPDGVAVRDLFERATRELSAFSAGAHGLERERLLNDAAKHFDELLKLFPTETNLCAQSLHALGSIHATRGETDEAVRLYAAVGDKYPSEEWEVLQVWKAAGDLLWDAKRRDEAKRFYEKIVAQFGKTDAPQIISTVVRGAKARLAE